MKNIRVVIADDAIQYRAILSRLLHAEPRIQIVGEAVNGIEALELIWESKPDVVLMDFEMPIMDGMTALQHLMIHVPTPTIMFSRLTREGTARCFDALKNGAVDFFCKDTLHAANSDSFLHRSLIEKVICASQISIAALEPVFPRSPLKHSSKSTIKTLVFCEECGSKEELILRENEDQGGVICTRCGEYVSLEQRNKYRRANCLSIIVGGAGAYSNLLKIVPSLRQDINGAVLIVIDGSVEHVDAFAEYLDAISTINIVRIRDGLSIQGGNCYIGCDNENIHLKPYSAEYSLRCSVDSNREIFPVEKTVRSIANVFKERATLIFISGKKTQGEAGLITLKENNGNLIVLERSRCLYKTMVDNIQGKFTPLVARDEDNLTKILSKIHAHYRDTIVMA
ncbi:MAG: chemotaxis protein CheB [Desulfopila sp.]|jgi:two-component system chemotaxis response regulator CheB|nr:chemotaxis protein CheB [Desulfopila sp.]